MIRFLRIIPLAAVALLPAAASAGDLQPNELGRIMILEYHKIDLPEERWTRTPANFRRDLERLWERGYRLVALNDVLDGKIGIRRGTTPVVLTFDDSSPGQFKLIEKNGEWVTMREAAAKLNVSHHQVRRLIKEGVLLAEQVVPDAPYQIRATDLHDERVTSALARKGRPCRAIPENQTSIFSDT